MITHATMIFITTGLFGATAGIIGSWLFLEQKSLFADTIAHATLPGITIIFLITHHKHPLLFMLAAITSSLVAAKFIQKLLQTTTLKKDTILGIVLAASFGIGSMLLSKIQQLNLINSGLITKYFLGNIATIMQQDCSLIIVMSILCLITILIYYKRYNIIIFDPTLSNTLHIPLSYISTIILLVTTLTIVTGLQIIGIILMSSLLINPAAAAYQWTKNLPNLMYLAAFFGLLETTLGIYISSQFHHVPPGPIITIIATIITFFSILFGPEGVVISWYQNKRQTKELSIVQLLSRFLLFNESKTDPFYAHDIITLTKIGKEIPPDQLINLEQAGYITSPKKNFWALTPKGLKLLKNIKIYDYEY